jgi:hypothetical protein
MRIYLDANILYGFFKNLIKSWQEKQKYTLPDVIKFFVDHQELIIYTSILTKSEIFRRLKLEYNISEKDLERMWMSLERLLKIRLIEEVVIDSQLIEFIKKCKFRSKINNIIHLWLCYKLSLTFVTGDEKIYEDGKKIYSNIMNYSELRKRIK